MDGNNRTAPRFPTMLRKMWSGGDVQAWIDANWPTFAAGEGSGGVKALTIDEAKAIARRVLIEPDDISLLTGVRIVQETQLELRNRASGTPVGSEGQWQEGEAQPWREAFERAMKQTWGMVDPLNPAGQPGSYWRGEYNGIVGSLQTLRENFERELRRSQDAALPSIPRGGEHG